MTLFHESWWLDAVAPGRWAAAQVKNGDHVLATMPYVLRRKLGLTFLVMPPLTQVLGPMVTDGGDAVGKYAKMLSRQKDVYQGLLEALPPYDLFRQSFHPGITNWLPFYWRGFAQTTRYTYRLDLTQPGEALWAGTQDKVRTDIRKAERMLQVRDEPDPDRFVATLRLTFERQNMGTPIERDIVARIFEAAPRHIHFKALSASGADGKVHAVAMFLGDANVVYYLLGGADPALRNSGCQSLLVWNGIQWAAGFSKVFDFEGSMIEGVERFVRGFGARQHPYFQVTGMSRRMTLLWHGAAMASAVLGKRTSVFST